MTQVGGPTWVRGWAGLAQAGHGELVGQLVLGRALHGEDARLGECLEGLGGIGWDVDLAGLMEQSISESRASEDHVLH